MTNERRTFLIATALGMGTVGAATQLFAAAPKKAAGHREQNKASAKPAPEDDSNSAPENLMLQHAGIERLLFVFDAAAFRLRSDREVSGDALHEATILLRKLSVSLHEKSEEELIFPALGGEERLATLIETLKAQHEAARTLNNTIATSTAEGQFAQPASRETVARACEVYVRMYRAHMAREATMLYPKLYDVLPDPKMDRLNDEIEEREEKILGDGGVNAILAAISDIEHAMGVGDLARLTPKLS